MCYGSVSMCSNGMEHTNSNKSNCFSKLHNSINKRLCIKFSTLCTNQLQIGNKPYLQIIFMFVTQKRPCKLYTRCSATYWSERQCLHFFIYWERESSKRYFTQKQITFTMQNFKIAIPTTLQSPWNAYVIIY